MSVLLGIPEDPIAIMAWNARAPPRQPAGRKSVVATFVITGRADNADEILKSVYLDLTEGNRSADISLQEPERCIRIVSPTEEAAMELVRMAQELASNHLSGHSTKGKARLIFAEPPASCKTGIFRINVKHDAAKHAHLSAADVPRTQGPTVQPSFNRYAHGFSNALCEAFKRASYSQTSLILRVHLGHYHLETYKLGDFTQEQFDNIIKHPRAAGQFETCLGKASGAKGLSVKAAMRLIQAPGSLCFPMSSQTDKPALVTPVYLLETCHNGDLYETQLVETVKDKVKADNGPLKFELMNTIMVPKDAQVPKFEAINISVGRRLDWKIVATPGCDQVKTPPAVKKYLEMKPAEMRGSRNDFRSYPTVPLIKGHKLASKFQSVVMKSIYRYSWKHTGYVVQFTINRRWKNVYELYKENAKIETDFDVTIYASNWDEDSRAHDGEIVGSIWGDDLQGLLRGETGTESGSAPSRILGLIKTMLDVRDFFEGSGRV